MTQATIVAGLEAATGMVGGFERQARFPWWHGIINYKTSNQLIWTYLNNPITKPGNNLGFPWFSIDPHSPSGMGLKTPTKWFLPTFPGFVFWRLATAKRIPTAIRAARGAAARQPPDHLKPTICSTKRSPASARLRHFATLCLFCSINHVYTCVYIYICKYSTWFYMQSLYYIWTMKNTMVDWLTSGLIRPNLLSGSTSPGAAFHLHQRNEVDPGQCLLDGTRGTRGRRETAGSWLAAGRQIPFMPWRC